MRYTLSGIPTAEWGSAFLARASAAIWRSMPSMGVICNSSIIMARGLGNLQDDVTVEVCAVPATLLLLGRQHCNARRRLCSCMQKWETMLTHNTDTQFDEHTREGELPVNSSTHGAEHVCQWLQKPSMTGACICEEDVVC